MRSLYVVRTALVTLFTAALFVGTAASAQDATEEMMMSDMMVEGACPEGIAATMLETMSMMMGMDMGMMMTDEPMMMATDEMGMMMTEEPMMMMTDEMDMMMTPEMDMTMSADMMMTDEAGMMGASCLFGVFSGAAEVPGPGDEDGYGVAFVTVDASTSEICYDIAVANITLPAAAMHIHIGAAGISGSVVVPFDVVPDEEGLASGCTTADPASLAGEIAMNPEGYYVNVHTSDFPDGAVRAQLVGYNRLVLSMSGMDMTEMMNMMSSMGMDMGMMEMTPEAGS